MTMTKFEEDTRELLHAMFETGLDEARSLKSFIQDAWPMLLLLVMILSVGIWFIRPAPPRHVLLDVGSQGGAYENMGKQYAEFFARNGITLELVHTAGAGENIARLRYHNDPLQAAFVQGGSCAARMVRISCRSAALTTNRYGFSTAPIDSRTTNHRTSITLRNRWQSARQAAAPTPRPCTS